MLLLVHAKCHVLDHMGRELALDAAVLPEGVFYNDRYDSFTCHEPSACRDWTIANCTLVECKHEYACRHAQLLSNQEVTCTWFNACREATISHSRQVVCGGPPNSEDYCRRATLIEPQSVLCHGPLACVTDMIHNGMEIYIGLGSTGGQIHCQNTLSKELACQHVYMHIHYGHEACIDEEHDKYRGCPIVCVNPWDCDMRTLRFLTPNENRF
ncbi:hypothetical protein ACA910_011204 [Epithemia clementina (nom. ined.)]